MKATVTREHALDVATLPTPEPAAGEVRVRLTACGICGSDLHFFHGGLWAPGSTPGHEMAGVVDALGEGVSGVSEGDAVVVEPLRSCGRCESCRVGRDATCPEVQIYGIHRAGGLAEYVCVEAPRLFAVPADLDPVVAALCEPMAVDVHALRLGRLEPGQRVIVLGAGSIGLLTVAAARAMGAGEVWLTARHAHQAELGKRLGATRVLREDEALPGQAELVVETVGGAADTLIQAGDAVAPGGVVSVVGVFMGRNPEIPALAYFLKETTLVFSNCYVHPSERPDFEEAARIVSDQREELAALTSHQVPLDDVARAFAIASDKKVGAVKVTVVP